MPRLCRPERSISPRPVTATGRKAPVDGDARAGGAGRGGRRRRCSRPPWRPRCRPGCRHGRPRRGSGWWVAIPAAEPSRVVEERNSSRNWVLAVRPVGVRLQSVGTEVWAKAGGSSAASASTQARSPGARRGIGRRRSCRTPERQPCRPDFGRVRQHPPPRPGPSETSPAGFRKQRIPPVARRRRPFPSGAPPSAEAVLVNRASEWMASSNRPASADAAAVTPVPHAALFAVFMPSTSLAFRSPPRWARSGAADSESPPLTRGAVARPFLLVTFERRKPNGSPRKGLYAPPRMRSPGAVLARTGQTGGGVWWGCLAWPARSVWRWGARRGIGRRRSCRTPERQPRRPDFGRVRQHPPSRSGIVGDLARRVPEAEDPARCAAGSGERFGRARPLTVAAPTLRAQATGEWMRC